MGRRIELRVLLLVLSTLLACAAPASADVYDDNPAAASRGPGDMVVLARGADGAIYERHLAGGAWTGWASLGGVAASGPAAAAYGDTIHAFVTGTDGVVYENVLRAGAWSGWTAVAGVATSAPAATARRGTNLLDLAVRGTDDALYFRSWQPGSGWSPWAGMGGNLTSAPALDSQRPGGIDVYHRGTDGQLVQRGWLDTAWSDWIYLGGGLTGAPALLSRAQGIVDVFVRGTDHSLFQKHWEGAWGDWVHIDGRPIDSTPAAVSDTPGHVVLFARLGGGLAFKEWRDTSGWGPWTDWGPVAPPPPPAAPLPDGSVSLDVGVRCTPPGGRLRVSLRIHKRPDMPKPRVRMVTFFVKGGPRRTDRRRPYMRRLRINRPAGSTGRVYARAVYTRKGSQKVRRKTVSRRFVMCG